MVNHVRIVANGLTLSIRFANYLLKFCDILEVLLPPTTMCSLDGSLFASC